MAMPRKCDDCGTKHPDAVSLEGGTYGVKYCINCGASLKDDQGGDGDD